MHKCVWMALCCAVQFATPMAGATVPGEDFSALRKKARALEYGEGTTKNTSEAIALYCQAAKQGDVDALFRLGWIHAYGKGVPRDDALAAYFFAKAAEQGHPQSKNLLPRMGSRIAEAPTCMQDVLAHFSFATNEQRKLAELIKRLATEYGVAPNLAILLAMTESNLNPRALSIKNAQGLMQLTPETAERFNVRKPFDPEQNVRGGLAYLRWLLAYFQGDVKLALAAYNAGEGVVNKYQGVPPYPETRAYVSKILSVYKQEAHPFDPAITAPSPEIGRITLKRSQQRI